MVTACTYLRMNLQVTFKCAWRRRVGTHAGRGLYNVLKSKPHACNPPEFGRREKKIENKMKISRLFTNITFCAENEKKKPRRITYTRTR